MRVKCLCALAILAAGWTNASMASDETDILQPIDRFFEAFARRDKAGIVAEAAAPDVPLMSERQGELRRLTVEGLGDVLQTAFKGSALSETLHNPVIRVDGTLGMVWAPYELLVDGKPDHCGTDIFTLLKVQGRWQIVGITDNRHAGC